MSNSEIDAQYYKHMAFTVVWLAVLVGASWTILHFHGAVVRFLGGLLAL